MKRLYALRGATRCENTEEDIRAQVAAMYSEMLELNKFNEEDIVSIIFSVTGDLNAINPCTALRKTGYAQSDTALFSAQEPGYASSLERTIRVMIHCYLEEGSKVKHVYRNGAEVLRPDRIG